MANMLLNILSKVSPEFQSGQQLRKDTDRQNALNDIKLRQAQRGESSGIRDEATNEKLRVMQVGNRVAKDLASISDFEQKKQVFNNQLPLLRQIGFDDEDISELYDDDPGIWQQKLQNSILASNAFIEENNKNKSSSLQEFEYLTKGMSPEDINRAKRQKLYLDPKPQGSASQTIFNMGTADKIADVERTLARGKEEGKGQAQLKFKPMIQKAVKLAEAEAKERGEVLTDYARSQAALPGLIETVGELKKLAPVATSTFGGRAFDLMTKELGFGSTDGATARKKFIAIVNNQVLPLLKQTFGAAFTAAEGDALRATMGDPNSTPEEKMVELDAFINNKMRVIEAQKTQLNQGTEPTQVAPDSGFDPSLLPFMNEEQKALFQ